MLFRFSTAAPGLAAAALVSLAGAASAQSTPGADPGADPGTDSAPSALVQSDSTASTNRAAGELGTAEGDRLMQEAEQAISSQDYASALDKLQAARTSLNLASQHYQELAGVFAGIDPDITTNLRDRARAAAQTRDQATYQQALVYRAQNRPELAVPLLIEIVESQGPTRDLGQRAYQQLFELGFVGRPFGRVGEDTSSTALRPLGQADSPVGIGASAQLIAAAEQAAASQNLEQAATTLQTAREQLNQVSGYYQTLVGIFSGVDTRVASDARSRALEAALLRDDATYQQALVYRAQNRPQLAIPLLVEVLQSQNPTRDLGQRAYQQLFELGFVELPYPGEAVPQ